MTVNFPSPICLITILKCIFTYLHLFTYFLKHPNGWRGSAIFFPQERLQPLPLPSAGVHFSFSCLVVHSWLWGPPSRPSWFPFQDFANASSSSVLAPPYPYKQVSARPPGPKHPYTLLLPSTLKQRERTEGLWGRCPGVGPSLPPVLSGSGSHCGYFQQEEIQ